MTKEELKNQIIELKENCKKLAEEYRERYNQDNENRIALNMFYHNVISYNDYESVLALIENRNSIIMCFSAPPVLTEETVEINLKRIAELEKENAELKERNKELLESCKGATMMYNDLCKAKEIIKSLMLFAEIDCREYEEAYKKAEQFLKDIKEG